MIIHPKDNVEVNLNDGHKYALCDIAKDEYIIKFGNPIGHAICAIQKGEHVHTHNMRTNLSGNISYKYRPKPSRLTKLHTSLVFQGYMRENGGVGIRNDIWIINTVGCVNKVAERLSSITGAKCFSHPFGCSQLGDDMKLTQYVLRGLVKHPNAGGILVLGLGCENNNITAFRQVLGDVPTARIRYLNAQDFDDEIVEGVKLINELKEYADSFPRVPIPLSRLKIGLKCGGSDGFSGITANPLVGRFSDLLISYGGSCVLTEVPEMFGAEHLLMERCPTEALFHKTVNLINNFKDYFVKHGQVIYENPSPGNKAGGITTLEEKSLGCIQKGGSAEISDILNYGDMLTKPGLSLLNGPGNDIVAITNLAACGVHMILFTTGRGTPVGGPVPTIKIATNYHLSHYKPNWIDFDASPVLDGRDLTETLLNYVIRVANGEKTCNNEENGYEEISIFKDGVIL